jgi:aspartate aminotransferase-like enzyme
MPTDALVRFSEAMKETEEVGFENLRARQQELGDKVRSLLDDRGYKSVAAEGFRSPTVVVCHTDDVAIQNGSKFAAQGLQIAAGVPLMCDEPTDFRSFRIGLFGLDKIGNVDRTVANLEQALDAMAGS